MEEGSSQGPGITGDCTQWYLLHLTAFLADFQPKVHDIPLPLKLHSPSFSAESYTTSVEEPLATTSETASRLGKAILLYTEPEQGRTAKHNGFHILGTLKLGKNLLKVFAQAPLFAPLD